MYDLGNKGGSEMKVSGVSYGDNPHTLMDHNLVQEESLIGYS